MPDSLPPMSARSTAKRSAAHMTAGIGEGLVGDGLSPLASILVGADGGDATQPHKMAKAMKQLQRELQDLRDEQTATKAQLASVQAENGRLEQKVGSLEADLLKATKDAAEQKGRADFINQSMSAWQGHATTVVGSIQSAAASSTPSSAHSVGTPSAASHSRPESVTPNAMPSFSTMMGGMHMMGPGMPMMGATPLMGGMPPIMFCHPSQQMPFCHGVGQQLPQQPPQQPPP